MGVCVGSVFLCMCFVGVFVCLSVWLDGVECVFLSESVGWSLRVIIHFTIRTCLYVSVLVSL